MSYEERCRPLQNKTQALAVKRIKRSVCLGPRCWKGKVKGESKANLWVYAACLALPLGDRAEKDQKNLKGSSAVVQTCVAIIVLIRN